MKSMESRNDEYPYREIAGQDEFNHFQQIFHIKYNDNALTIAEDLHILYLNGGVQNGNNEFEY